MAYMKKMQEQFSFFYLIINKVTQIAAMLNCCVAIRIRSNTDE